VLTLQKDQKFNIKKFSIYRENHFGFRYDFRPISSMSNFDTIIDINRILDNFRYVRNFRFDTHVFTTVP